MKTIKHLITMDCPRQCSYCINEKIKGNYQKRAPIARTTRGCYEILRGMGYDALLLSGGEPTLDESRLSRYAHLGTLFFKHISVISANPNIVSGAYNDLPFNDIMFSLHSSDRFTLPRVKARQPVYLMMMVEEIMGTMKLFSDAYSEWCYRAKQQGFAGMTIHEEYPDGQSVGYLLPQYANFSTRYKDAQTCVTGDMLADYKLFDGGAIHVE